MNKMFFENGVVHEFTDEEMKLLKFAVSRLHPYAETFFSVDEIEQLNEASDNLRSLFCDHLD